VTGGEYRKNICGIMGRRIFREGSQGGRTNISFDYVDGRKLLTEQPISIIIFKRSLVAGTTEKLFYYAMFLLTRSNHSEPPEISGSRPMMCYEKCFTPASIKTKFLLKYNYIIEYIACFSSMRIVVIVVPHLFHLHGHIIDLIDRTYILFDSFR
jgi:hypothetical protein